MGMLRAGQRLQITRRTTTLNYSRKIAVLHTRPSVERKLMLWRLSKKRLVTRMWMLEVLVSVIKVDDFRFAHRVWASWPCNS
ncbi:hypothetical protein HanPI659440_Chr04g0155081 [Helianthus annuus]|uniref:Uncharacterized protein n=1 Tax=Helianthus annuus TaxID=4232 RepID=A0A9K3J7X1_HELAN|nr:hypothetical protein HanXRQr2_Chr04g0157691 [Helianthus annuus]KAJ0588054.1 hypothetical protein HanIR_Chr04g0170181 [Helianthus annuus]KAJ0795839.1 hypothetical protein HanPI659440_Chr04g0155081 [Helianthus annuus]